MSKGIGYYGTASESKAFAEGLARGLTEGTRRERKALRAWFRRQRESHKDCILGDGIKFWLKSRAREGKK